MPAVKKFQLSEPVYAQLRALDITRVRGEVGVLPADGEGEPDGLSIHLVAYNEEGKVVGKRDEAYDEAMQSVGHELRASDLVHDLAGPDEAEVLVDVPPVAS